MSDESFITSQKSARGSSSEDAVTKLTKPKVNDSEEIKLLREWFKWFWTNEDAPNKMPDSLHTKTITLLVEYEHENKKRFTFEWCKRHKVFEIWYTTGNKGKHYYED